MLLLLFIFFMTLLHGCKVEPSKEVKCFVKKINSSKFNYSTKIPKYSEIKIYNYTAENLRSPFVVPVNLFAHGQNEGDKNNIKSKPDPSRVREKLEYYPLDSYKMVGYLSNKKKASALIKDKKGIIHIVWEGNYIGQNSGKISKIFKKYLDVNELVPNGKGGWMLKSKKLILES